MELEPTGGAWRPHLTLPLGVFLQRRAASAFCDWGKAAPERDMGQPSWDDLPCGARARRGGRFVDRGAWAYPS